MNVFDYVYGFITVSGKTGVVRGDSIDDAIDRINDYTGDDVKKIMLLNRLDNDYGVVLFNEGRD